MRTNGGGDGEVWICSDPKTFDRQMVQSQGDLVESSSRYTWDAIKVTRDGQELGSLFLLRQCLELWENEMKKWGCNGLGEKLDDKLLVFAHMPCFTTKLTKFS